MELKFELPTEPAVKATITIGACWAISHVGILAVVIGTYSNQPRSGNHVGYCLRPEKYVPSMKGNKYAIVLTQITSLLHGSKDALCIAQRLVKLMGKGWHKCADIVG